MKIALVSAEYPPETVEVYTGILGGNHARYV